MKNICLNGQSITRLLLLISTFCKLVSCNCSIDDFKSYSCQITPIYKPVKDAFIQFSSSDGTIYLCEDGRLKSRTPSNQVSTLNNIRCAPFSTMQKDSKGNFYIADWNAYVIFKISSNGQSSVFAGNGNSGSEDGQGTLSSFGHALYLAIDAQDNVFVSDYYNHKIRKITPDGLVTTFIGESYYMYPSFSKDGQGTNAVLYGPTSIVIDSNGIMYLAEYMNSKIRKITPEGNVSTIAGNGLRLSKDGQGTNASFSRPQYLNVDSCGNIYVLEAQPPKIRRISATGKVTTISYAGFDPESINVYSSAIVNDNLYVSDHSTLFKIKLSETEENSNICVLSSGTYIKSSRFSLFAFVLLAIINVLT